MDNESEVIHQQMDETRSALQDKLETLEQQVKNTVQDATDAVSDTVATVKDAVEDTVETVKDTVHDTVETVKGTFDIVGHVQAHPWPMVLGATAVGFVVGRLLSPRLSPSTSSVAELANRPVGIPTGNGFAMAQHAMIEPAEPKKSWWSWLNDHYGEEIGRLKGLALGTIGGMVRDMATASAPPSMATQIKEVVDSTTVKLGGQVVEGPILSPAKDDVNQPGQQRPHPANAGRPAANAAW